MTDMECVAGVVTLPEYCLPGPDNKYGRREGGRYYEHARELATLEVNAAVDGLLEAGASEVLVHDGHGPGGLNVSLLHSEARMLTGRGKWWPIGLDRSFDAAIMIGQHARANTDGGHLCHSGSFDRDDWTLNGRSVGEIELYMLMAAYFDVPTVMISGDAAACEQAREFVPSIVGVAVIEGQSRGSSKGMTVDEAIDLNVPAIHVAPTMARRMIQEGARRCLKNVDQVERYWVDPPYEMIRLSRPRPDGTRQRSVATADDYLDVMMQKPQYETVPA
jgi:D-amino peptidase